MKNWPNFSPSEKCVWITTLLCLIGLATCALVAAVTTDRLYMAPFREAQTAISTRYLRLESAGPATYATPVLGVPWRIPMELGVFQWLVAGLQTMGFSEDGAGRLLSTVFYLACAALVWQIARQLRVCNSIATWIAFLFILGPVHIAYGTAFLIESCALSACLLHISSGLAWLAQGRAWQLVTCIAAGSLGAMIKGPTWAPAAVLLASCALLHSSRERGVTSWFRGLFQHRIIAVGVALAVAVISGLIWVHYSDEVKSDNYTALSLTSEKLKRWNFGDWDVKLSPRIWGSVLAGEMWLLLGPGFLLLFPVVIWRTYLKWKYLSAGSGSDWAFKIAALFAAFISAPLVFTNLHYVHRYYVWANGVYLILAIGMWLDLIGASPMRRWMQCLLPVSCLAAGVVLIGYHRLNDYPREERLIRLISRFPQHNPIAMWNFDWSSRVPYHAGVRAWFLQTDQIEDGLRQAVQRNAGESYALVIWKGGEDAAVPQLLRDELLGDGTTSVEIWPGVWAATRRELEPYLLALASAKDDMIGLREEAARFIYQHQIDMAQTGWAFGDLSASGGNGRPAYRFAYRKSAALLYLDFTRFKIWRFADFYDSKPDEPHAGVSSMHRSMRPTVAVR